MAMIDVLSNGTKVESPEWVALEAARCLFHGLGDRSRLAIVQHLLNGEHRVVDLTNHLGLAQGTVSKHLACLRDCGVATMRSEGRASYYALAYPEATREVLVAAENLLALTGDAVVLCPTFGSAAIEHSRDDGAGSR